MKAIVLTISDTRTEETDASGDLLVGLLSEFGAVVMNKSIVIDDDQLIREALIENCASGHIDLIITTGGTGFAGSDVTPEATRAVIDKEAPGIAEAMRRETTVHTPMAMLSRGVCGIRGKTLIMNFPGSPKGVNECFEVVRPVLKHAVQLIGGETRHSE